MIQKILSTALLLLLMISLTGNCFAEEVDYETVYTPVLEELYHTMTCTPEDRDWENGSTGIIEVCIANTTKDVLTYIGYAITDLSGDGIPELLICDIHDPKAKEISGKYIYTVYTCVEGTPIKVFDGWYRNQFYALPDGTFYNIGSNGAAYHVMSIRQLTPDGTELKYLDYYFTYPTDDTIQEIAVFYNTIGESDISTSQQAEISLDDLWQMESVYDSLAMEFPLISFAETFGIPSSLTARWNDSQQVVLTAQDGDVSDLKILDIRYASTDDWGDITYEVENETSYGSLHQSQSLTLSLEFIGDIPNTAITYTDSVGTIHTYTLSISGENGELILGNF